MQYVVTDGISYVAGYFLLGDVRMPYLTAEREKAKWFNNKVGAGSVAHVMGLGWRVEPRYLTQPEF